MSKEVEFQKGDICEYDGERGVIENVYSGRYPLVWRSSVSNSVYSFTLDGRFLDHTTKTVLKLIERPKKDNSEKRWNDGLSVKSANILVNYFDGCRGTKFDFPTATKEEAQMFLYNQIVVGGINVKSMRNAGRVAEKEILRWLGALGSSRTVATVNLNKKSRKTIEVDKEALQRILSYYIESLYSRMSTEFEQNIGRVLGGKDPFSITAVNIENFRQLVNGDLSVEDRTFLQANNLLTELNQITDDVISI
jgi:hypothetical protein